MYVSILIYRLGLILISLFLKHTQLHIYWNNIIIHNTVTDHKQKLILDTDWYKTQNYFLGFQISCVFF